MLEDNLKEKYYKEILEFLCNHADLNFFVISKDGRYLLKSSKMEDISGKGTLRADTFDKKAWKDLLEVMNSKTTKVIEEKYEGINPAYDEHWFLSVKSPLIKNDNVEGVMGVAIDITERKRTEQKLKEITQRLESVLDTIPGHVYLKDKKGSYIWCNRLQATNFGISKEEIVGKTDYDLLDENTANELRKIDKEVFDTGTPVTIEEIGKVLGEERIFLSRKVPFYDLENKSEIVGVLGVSIDITEKKLTERELIETKHKLEGMTLVSASIAHELRTPLQSLSLSVDSMRVFLPTLLEGYSKAEEKNLLTKKLKKSTIDSLNGLLEAMDKEIYSASENIDLTLNNLRSEDITEKEVLNQTFYISKIINMSLERYPYKNGEKKLITFCSENDFQIKGNELFMFCILRNLIKNALYYIAKARKGKIDIWLKSDLDKNCLYFRDTGTGISKDTLKNIFDQFFTQTNHGFGIGLRYCKVIMKKMGGDINCKSEEGEFTLFTLEFPKLK